MPWLDTARAPPEPGSATLDTASHHHQSLAGDLAESGAVQLLDMGYYGLLLLFMAVLLGLSVRLLLRFQPKRWRQALRPLPIQRNHDYLRALSNSPQERCRLLMQGISDCALVMLDGDGHITTWDGDAQKLLGYEAPQILGRHVSLLYQEDAIACEQPQLDLQQAAQGERCASEGWRRRADGSAFWSKVVILAVRNDQGKLVGYAMLNRDSTEHWRAEEALKRSEERFRMLVQSVSDYAIYMLDHEGRVMTWNEGAQRLTGYEASEVIGHNFANFYPDSDRSSGKPQIELWEAQRNGRFEDEGWRLRKDGCRYWANVILTAIKGQDGQLIGYTKVTRDLTERRHTEEELRRSEERFRLLLAGVKDYAIFMIDPRGFVMTWNEGAQRVQGYRLHEVMGRHYSQFFLPDDIAADKPLTILDAALKDGKFEDEGWLLRKDGSSFAASILVSPIRDSNANLLGFAAVTRDLSQRLRTEQELWATTEWRRAILDSANFAIISTDSQGVIQTFNAAAEKLLGYSAHEAIGHLSLPALHDPQEIAACAARQSDQLRPSDDFAVLTSKSRLGQADENEWTYIRKDGVRILVSLSLTALRGRSGEITGFLGISSDISEKKRVQEELRYSRERYELVVRGTNEGIWDQTGGSDDPRSLYLSPTCLRILGYPEDAHPSLFGVLRRVHRDDRAKILAARHAYLTKATPQLDVEFRFYLPPHREERWFHAKGLALWDQHGKVERFAGTLHDISDRKRAVEALHRSEQKLRELMHMAPVGIFQTNDSGRCLFVNDCWSEISGLTAEAVLSHGWLQAVHPNDQAAVELAWNEAVMDGQDFAMEFRFRQPGGEERWVACRAIPVQGDDGRHGGYLGVVQDVTPLKAALHESTFYRRALDHADIVAFTDKQGIITYVNDLFCEITGYDRVELIGQDHRLLNSGAMPKGFFAGMWSTITQGRIWKGDICNRGKDGNLFWVDTTIVPFLDTDGEPLHYIAILRDITEKMKQQQQLSLALARAESATKAKSEFLANMSHEIRTPINGIFGMIDMLRATKLDRQQHDYAVTIQNSADSLITVINDILDFSKIEAGKLDMDSCEFDVGELMRDINRALRFLAQKKGIELRLVIKPLSQHYLLGDPGRLRQVLTNLINNAIKFTHEGSVTLQIAVKEVCEKTVTLRFVVSDTGIGIPPHALAHLFVPFSQADSSTSRKYGGTGLGLSISKKLVTLMGGTIGVESNDGQGSRFWFEIPFTTGRPIVKPLPLTNLGPSIDGKIKNMRILVAEDNIINQKIALNMLERLGYRAVTVANGEEVIKTLQEVPYDLILMDCQMPEMDGYEASRQIRLNGQDRIKQVPIVAMTANALKGDREKCLAAGMTDYLAKPVRIEELERVLKRWLSVTEL